MPFCNFDTFLKNEWIISKDKKSKRISILICLFGWAICVRFLGTAFISDPKIWSLIGDPFYCTGDRVLFNIILFGCSLFGSLYRTVFIFGQISDNFVLIQKMMNLGPKSHHGLTARNVEKMKFVSKFCSIVILRLMRNSFSGIFCAVYVYYGLVAYFSNEYEFSVFWFLVWLIILQTWAHFITSPIVLAYAMLYFTVFYMKQRFKQLNEMFVRIKKTERPSLLLELFRAHNKLSIIIYKYNEFFKYLIFCNHSCVTIIVTLMYYIFFFGSAPLFLRSANLAVGVLDTIMIFLVTRFAGSLAKETISLYSDINSYVCNYRLSYRIKWKVQYFVEWLSGPTIGIYCSDFFPLTSLGFFEYFFNCLTNFLLLVGLLKEYFGYNY